MLKFQYQHIQRYPSLCFKIIQSDLIRDEEFCSYDIMHHVTVTDYQNLPS